MHTISKFHPILWLIILVIGVSCSKDQDDSTALTDNALAEGEAMRIWGAFHDLLQQSGMSGVGQQRDNAAADSLPPCATITYDTSGTASTLTIDFGSTPCLCSGWDNKYRMGRIMATWTGPWWQAGTVLTIITENYYAGYQPNAMYRFDYAKTITHMGQNSNGNTYFDIQVSTALITLPNGQTISWTSQRQLEWTNGANTWWKWDNIFQMTGSASGTDRNGNPFSATITNPLVIKAICPWITQGTIEFVRQNFPPAVLDYGPGTCDASATITVNGKTYTITLN